MIFGPSDKRIKTTDINRDTSFHKTAGYTLFDHKKNEEILEEVKEQVDENLKRQKSNSLHATRMNNNRLPKIMLNYRPNGRRLRGRTLERLIDEAETVLARPNS